MLTLDNIEVLFDKNFNNASKRIILTYVSSSVEQ